MSVRGIKVEFSKLMNYLSKHGDKTILFQTQMHAPKYKHTKILKGCFLLTMHVNQFQGVQTSVYFIYGVLKCRTKVQTIRSDKHRKIYPPPIPQKGYTVKNFVGSHVTM